MIDCFLQRSSKTDTTVYSQVISVLIVTKTKPDYLRYKMRWCFVILHSHSLQSRHLFDLLCMFFN